MIEQVEVSVRERVGLTKRFYRDRIRVRVTYFDRARVRILGLGVLS